MNSVKVLFQGFRRVKQKTTLFNTANINRGREKIRLSLDHFKDLDPRFAHRVNPGEHNLIDLLRILRGLGAPAACHVISSDNELDGREMGLAEALSAVIGRRFGTFVSWCLGNWRVLKVKNQENNTSVSSLDRNALYRWMDLLK